ncbi:MAG: hypothetical protein C0606_08865 [Hyphomicrobiales bacterium]|nr:MAG: hypothetical protein C0606_08865 [Hyphomicrobiales bacterium]
MDWTLIFSPMLPVPVLIGFGVIAFLLFAGLLITRTRGVAVRALALALLVLALFNPSLEREKREPLTSVLPVIVDRSESQRLDIRAGQSDALRDAVSAAVAGLKDVELRLVETRREGDAGFDGTALFGPLAEALADVPPNRVAGAILITDGQVDDVPPTLDRLGFDAPLHALVTGRPGEADRRVVIEKAPRFGLVGSQQTIRLRFAEEGAGGTDAAATARVTVRQDGNEVGSAALHRGESADVSLTIPHAGKNILEFEIETLDGELTTLNNRAVVAIEGIRENLRVLLVSGEPHAGERTWRNLLKSDASVDLVHFTILRPPEKQDSTPISELSLIAFPTRELFSEKIDEFDLIIFDRYQRRGVLPTPYFDNMARFVRDGGAILMAAGPEFAGPGTLDRTALGLVMPASPTGRIIEEPYKPAISENGARHPVTRELASASGTDPEWSRWFRLIEAEDAREKPVMTGADGKPLLFLHRVGEGRVALLLSDHVWLWARGFEGGGPHGPLLRRLAHWLMKEPDLEEEALRLTAKGRHLTVERQTLAEETRPVTLTGPLGDERTITLAEGAPGLWRAEVAAADIGLYTARDGALTALASVGPTDPQEFANVVSTPERLRALTEASGGSARRVAGADGVAVAPRILAMKGNGPYAGRGWIGIRTGAASTVTGIDRLPLLAGLIGLALLLGALSLAWYREGR